MARHRLAVAYDCLFPFTTGGGERQYRAFAEHAVRAGLTVDYLTSVQWPGEPPTDTAFEVVPVCGRLRLYDERGVRRTPAALAYAWGLFRALARRRSSYDAVVVSGLPVLNVFAARTALIGSRTAVVVDYLEVWGRRQWLEYAGRVTGTIAWVLQRAAIALTPTATCHSRLTAQRLRAEGFRGRLLVSPGLIDGETEVVAAQCAASPPFVLYAGRHIPDKRVEALPAAVAHARRTVPDLRLVILGDGPSSPAVDAAIEAADAASWTTRPGFVTEQELAQLMREATALVNPSRREGYGLVVVEAAAFGTPVVLVGDEGNAATELVEPGVNGYIAGSAAPADLAAGVLAAVEGGDGLRASTRSWYEEAVRTRTVERTVAQLLSTLGLAPQPEQPGAEDRSRPTTEGPQ